MNAKVSTITLTCSNGDRDFEISHAERLLRMHESGWRIKNEKDWKINKDGTISRRNKEGTERTEKES